MKLAVMEHALIFTRICVAVGKSVVNPAATIGNVNIALMGTVYHALASLLPLKNYRHARI